MAKSEHSAIADLMKHTKAVASLNPMFRPQFEHYWQAQEKMLQEAEVFTRHWFERRHAATRTALEAVQDVANGGSDPADALGTVSDWQRHSVERVFEDFSEWLDLCTRCAGHATRAEVEAEQEALEAASKQVASGAKKKHATPV